MKLTQVTFIKPENLPAHSQRSSGLVQQIVEDIKKANGQAIRYKVEGLKKYTSYSVGKALRKVVANAKVIQRSVAGEGDFLYVTLEEEAGKGKGKK